MNFQHDDGQVALLDALEKLLAQNTVESADGKRSFFDDRLDSVLAESGLIDAAGIDEFGPLSAALIVDRVCRLPAIVEIAVSSFVRPLVCPNSPRPVAIVVGDIRRPARFLCEARSVLFIDEMETRIAELVPGDAAATEEFFAYPMGRLIDAAACFARAERIEAAVDIRRLSNVAIACEIAGALQGAVDSVIEHVKTRRQFGRALGSFQAVQHRLAGGATKIAACRLLAQRAAALGSTADALLALGYAQDIAPTILYDLHQFMGAMGLTLEHPLYRWSYRIKLLLSEFGGASIQYRELAAALWNEDASLSASRGGATR